MLPDERDKVVFSQFFVVERGQVLETRFYYDLPQVAHSSEGRWRYTLLIQKQPGTNSTPVSFTIVLPPGAQLLTTSPSPRVIDEETLMFALELNTDILVEVTYK